MRVQDLHQLPIDIQFMQLLSVASLEFSLAGEKTTVAAFFLKFHLTAVTCLCSSAQILPCILNTSVKQLKPNVYIAGLPCLYLSLCCHLSDFLTEVSPKKNISNGKTAGISAASYLLLQPLKGLRFISVKF